MEQVVHDEYRRHGAVHWWIEGRRRIFTHLLDRLVPLPKSARILDVGPGSGVNLPVLAPRGATTVVDVDLGSLRACREAGAANVVVADAANVPVRDGTFDLVCALDVIEHLDDDGAALRAFRRVTKHGGRLLVSVPALRILWGRQDVLSGHRRRYRRAELRTRIVDAGFTIERLSYFNTLLFPPILAVRLALRPFLRRAAKRSDLDVPAFGLNGALTRIFAAERHLLARHDLPFGVSLVCVARAGGG